MSLRIGERDSSDLVSSARPGVSTGRTRTAVSDLAIGGDGDGSRSDAGVVIRLSADARKLLARGDEEHQDALPARRGADDRADSDVGDATGQRGGAGTAPLAIGRPPSPDRSDGTGRDQNGTPGQGTGADQKTGRDGPDRGRATGAPRELSAEDKRVVTELSARDTAVRAHEAAHQAAAAGLGGAASFSYETGPDGRRYAVGGEVPVAIRPGRTPQETVANAQTVRSAALAPADPSAQDMAVASQAAQMEAEARQEIMSGTPGAQKGDGARGGHGEGEGGGERSDRSASSEPTAPPRDVQHDQIMVFSALKAERKTVDGIHQHLASGGSCAICSRAAARYA